MNSSEDASASVTLEESVNTVTLTPDPDGSIILHCPSNGGDDALEVGPEQKRVRISADTQNPVPQYAVSNHPEQDDSFELTMTTTEMTELDQEEIVQDGDSGSTQKADGVSPVSQAWFTTKEDKDTLANKGHKWKQGMWSKEEISILMGNIERYLKGRGIQDPTEIIFEMSKDERKDFYRSIAWGLNRPLFAVYRRVLRMYDNRNHVGKYTPEEIDKLKDLRTKHGNDWATIGAALGRSASSVKDRCRLMKDTCNTGKWTEDEERRLAEVVHELTGTEAGDAVTQGVSWASVAELVGTRSEKQCRSKWLNYLNWKQCGGTEWTKEDDMNLVHRIAELGVEDENEINWDILAGGWQSVRSPQWLRSKWWTIKRQVSNHKELPFSVLIKGLQDVVETQSYSKVLLVGSRPGNSSPPLTALQIPVQIPVQITHVSDINSNSPDSETITLNQGTFELLPSFHLQPTGTPGTYYLQTGANQSLPLTLTANPTVTLSATTSPTSSEQIILHSLTADGLNENMTVQMSHPGVIIQTMSSDICATETVDEAELGDGAQAAGKVTSSKGSTEPDELTLTLASKSLGSPAVDSGMEEGSVLVVPSTSSFIQTTNGNNMSSETVLPVGTLTDPILQNQEEGSD
ncbi:cyclin-D-binding Myb-like transcription factor 1 isoform X2 [Denticeps clupeoides]|uniref:cyclin-D-binding Myb-like transcription factor 1 isoform X2 n=1 Tax=Denticeps clupeoides TaxID=299321 RepID=UPI0010A4A7DF|nr:cyclin-D-binding Myb-like transcription factor 1 isoform X2 [Denticeps clupeoides]